MLCFVFCTFGSAGWCFVLCVLYFVVGTLCVLCFFRTFFYACVLCFVFCLCAALQMILVRLAPLAVSD